MIAALALLLGCAARRAPEPATEAAASDRAEEFRRIAEEYARKSPEQKYQELLGFLARAQEPARAELALRLGSLCTEEASKLMIRAAQPDRLEPDAALWWDRSVEAYQQFLAKYPDHERLDDALSGLGWSLERLGREDEALAAWTRLAEERPQSAWTSWAWREIGDYRFERGEFALARDAYAQATGDPDVSADARYKLASSHSQLGEPGLALAELRMLAALEPPQSDLRRKALQDLPRLYIDAGRAGQALGDLEPLAADPAEAALLLENLATTLESAGLQAEAARARARLAEIAPPTVDPL